MLVYCWRTALQKSEMWRLVTHPTLKESQHCITYMNFWGILHFQFIGAYIIAVATTSFLKWPPVQHLKKINSAWKITCAPYMGFWRWQTMWHVLWHVQVAEQYNMRFEMGGICDSIVPNMKWEVTRQGDIPEWHMWHQI